MVSLIIGIIALVLTLLFPIIGIIVSLIGIIVGIIGSIKKEKNSIIGLILSIVALLFGMFIMITSVKSTVSVIDNSRKDLFGDVAKSYINEVKNSLSTDEIICSPNASEDASNQFVKATSNGDYYIFISSSNDTITSKFSSFDSSISSKATEQTAKLLEFGGKSPWENKDVYGYVHFNIENNQKTYYIALADVDGHGIQNEVKYENIIRNNIEVKNVKVDVNKILNSISEDSKYYCHLK